MKPNVKKYLFPTIAVVALLVGFLIGNAVSNKVNAQRFFIQNGQIYQAPTLPSSLIPDESAAPP